METYKQLKGLIYLVIIAGVLIFLAIQFKSEKQDVHYNDTANVRLQKERNALEVRAGILEFQVSTLQNEISDLRGKEEPIKKYFAGKKTGYSARTQSETDREFLEVVR